MKVTLNCFRGKLRLRWTFEGKRECLSLGIVDSRPNRAYAERKAREIELDWLSGNYDRTLLKYKPKTLGRNASEISTGELFQRFSQHKQKDCGVSPRSIETRYNPVLRYLGQYVDCPAHEVGEQKARNFKAILVEKLTPQTAKERLWLLQSCWEWATGKYNLSGNPWQGLASGIKGQSSQRVKPFTTGEIAAILEAFRSHEHYSHYYPFVSFLFGAGCRFGEASALRWEHIGADFQTVWIGVSHSRGHHGTTKTGKSRTVVLSPGLSEMLRDRHSRLNPKPSDIAFPSPKGLPIDDHNFRNRAWKLMLTECHIEYRKPYNTRHSAISHALANGINPIALAEQTGHDKRVLLSTYAHAIQSQSVFVEF
jgi:integrase